jgi:glycogen operon protein
MLDFTGRLIHFRLAHPNLHRRKFFQDREIQKKTEFDHSGRCVVQHRRKAGIRRGLEYDLEPLHCNPLQWTDMQVIDEEGHPVIDDAFS